MINRAYICLTGQPGAGKTTLMEALLGAIPYESSLCVHASADPALKRPKESAPRNDPHLKRYVSAGADSTALYRFPPQQGDFIDEFFESDIMTEYSDIVLIEGDSPLSFLHLNVFVARPLPQGVSLIGEGMRDNMAEHEREIEEVELLAENPEHVIELMPVELRGALRASIKKDPDILRSIGDDFRRLVAEKRSRPAPAPTKQRMLAESHRGIEDAGLVVVNIHDESERERAEALVSDVARMRSDKEIFDELLDWRYHRTPVTAVVADLSDPKDAGRKKAITRIKRAIAKGKEG